MPACNCSMINAANNQLCFLHHSPVDLPACGRGNKQRSWATLAVIPTCSLLLDGLNASTHAHATHANGSILNHGHSNT